jgi:hypothetical protein
MSHQSFRYRELAQRHLSGSPWCSRSNSPSPKPSLDRRARHARRRLLFPPPEPSKALPRLLQPGLLLR